MTKTPPETSQQLRQRAEEKLQEIEACQRRDQPKPQQGTTVECKFQNLCCNTKDI